VIAFAFLFVCSARHVISSNIKNENEKKANNNSRLCVSIPNEDSSGTFIHFFLFLPTKLPPANFVSDDEWER
jgi:hypothetical protein